MVEERKVILTCDDITFLISRNIDGDLNRSETVQLYEHIATCVNCRDQMSQLSALESSMSDLRTHYQTFSPSPDFRQSIHKAISKKKKRNTFYDNFASFVQKLRNGLLFSGRFRPAFSIMGTVVVLCIGVLLWQKGTVEPPLSKERLIVYDIPLRTAEDRVGWNQQHTILPSQTIRLNIRESHSEPYFFKVSSLNPVGYSITHSQKVKRPQDFQLNGVQYITLKNPQLYDFVNIRNHGTSPIHLKTFSHSPQAIQAIFK